MIDDGRKKHNLVDLEGVQEKNLEQSYEKNYIVTRLNDSDRSNEETDIETQTIANMAVGNSKNDSDISNNKKYVFANASYANVLKQPSGMRRPLNIPAYAQPHLTCPTS